MAFNLQTFKTRALTAFVFAAVMLTGLLWNKWSFLVLFSVVHFGCWVEYQRLLVKIEPAYRHINAGHRFGVMIMGYGFMVWLTGLDLTVGPYLIAAYGWQLMWIGAIVFLMTALMAPRVNYPKLLGLSLLGFVYISLACGCLMQLWGNMDQRVFFGQPWLMPVILIAAIWINDTMAYIVGSFIGKTPFSPISPKKTWEGTIGGAILAIATVTLAGHFAFGFPLQSLLLISAIAAVFGTAGDLFESKLKRMADVKDSGNIMPGHGGFLDRFDSLLFASTITWLVFVFLLR